MNLWAVGHNLGSFGRGLWGVVVLVGSRGIELIRDLSWRVRGNKLHAFSAAPTAFGQK